MKMTRYMFDGSDLLSILPTASPESSSMIFKKQKELTIMKRFFTSVMAAAAVLNLCSCSNESIDKRNSDEAIVFDNVQTRAVVSSADELLSMGVFAQMNLGDDDKGEAGSNSYTMLLNNEHVSRTDSDDATPWTYEHTRYWVADRVFHFFAVWPYSGENSSVTNVSSVAGDGAYGYSVTFETPEAADQELLTAKATYKTKTGQPFPEAVDFDFQHELTNVNLKIWSNGADDNKEDKIRVKSVTISNVTKKGTLNTTLSGSSWNYSSDKMSVTKEYDGDGTTVSQAQIIDGKLVPNAISENNPHNDRPGIPFENGLLLIPHKITNNSSVIVTVIYDLQRPIDAEDNLWEEKTLQVMLPEGTWPAGKKLTYNLVISGERTITEFQINAVVEDWNTQTEEIDFSEQVEVTEKMQWVEGTYESLNIAKGEVVLYTDVDKVAICRFKIGTPRGATWTASLIPLTPSAMDAFSIVEGSKYGVVGSDEWQQVKIKINNPDPISARNACRLRITVQTVDGRTIVVKTLMPQEAVNNKIEEFTIIQNLING